MKLTGSLAYWLDYILFPVAIIGAVWFDYNSINLQWLAIAFFGLVSFTYIEYWAHRSALHGPFWHATHERHHKHPEEYVVFPWLIVPIGFAAALAVLFYFTGIISFWVGFATGYLWFIVWHHVLHHMDLSGFPRWVQDYATWHDRHHTNIRCNFGITVPFWDILHGTSK